MAPGPGVSCSAISPRCRGAVGKFIITQMTAVAELEAGLISRRTKAALAAAEARGAVLGGWRGGPVVEQRRGVEAIQRQAAGFSRQVQPIIAELTAEGASLRRIAA